MLQIGLIELINLTGDNVSPADIVQRSRPRSDESEL